MSNVPSANGSASARASCTKTFPPLQSTRSSIAGVTSTPSMRRNRSRARSITKPVPQPTSSSRPPPARAASVSSTRRTFARFSGRKCGSFD